MIHFLLQYSYVIEYKKSGWRKNPLPSQTSRFQMQIKPNHSSCSTILFDRNDLISFLKGSDAAVSLISNGIGFINEHLYTLVRVPSLLIFVPINQMGKSRRQFLYIKVDSLKSLVIFA